MISCNQSFKKLLFQITTPGTLHLAWPLISACACFIYAWKCVVLGKVSGIPLWATAIHSTRALRIRIPGGYPFP